MTGAPIGLIAGSGRLPLLFADAAERALFQNSQKFGLKTEFKFTNLIKKQSSSFSLFEQTFLASFGIRKRSLLVTEKLAFDQSARQGGAIDRDERTVGAV